MAIWKQLLLTLVLGAIAAVAWFNLDPQAPQRLAAIGIDIAAPAKTGADATGPNNASGRGQPGGNRGAGGGGFGGGRGGPVTVVTAPVSTANTNDVLNAIGTAKAARSVVLYPRAAGIVEAINFTPGQTVAQGSVLAQLDANTEEIDRDRAELAVATAQDKLDRYNTLRSGRTISTVQVTEAERELATAKLQLREAMVELEKRQVVAPFDGIVGLSDVEVGDTVSTTTEIVSLDQRSKLLVEYRVPEKYAAKIAIGQSVSATNAALPDQAFNGEVSAIGSRVEEDSRTLQVQALIDNESDTLRPGMSFSVQMRFVGDPHPSVPPLAIQWDRDGSYVWTVAEGRAARANVRIVERNATNVLIDSEIEEGTQVVIEGVQKLRPGAEVAPSGAGAQIGAADRARPPS